MSEYRRLIASKIYDYLKLKEWTLKKSGKLVMVKCPVCKKEPLTASIIPNVNEVHCIPCNKDFSILDFVRIIEPQGTLKDEEIYDYLKDLLNIKVQTKTDIDSNDTIFKMYQKNGFSLTPLYGNSHDGGRPSYGKACIEKEWVSKEHKDITEWNSWIDKGLNVGIRTGKVSNITVIDIDSMPKELKDKVYQGVATEEEKKEAIQASQDVLKKTLDELGHPEKTTAYQVTFGGIQLFYKFVPELRKTRIKEISTDIETTGGQVVCAPSKVGNTTRSWVGETIIEMPEELKKLLLSKMTNVPMKQSEPDTAEKIIKPTNKEIINFGLVSKGEGRSEYLTKMMGIFRQQFDEPTTRRLIKTLNKTHCKPPIPEEGLEATVLKSLNHYTNSDLFFLKNRVLEFLETAERARSDEIELAVFNNRIKGEDKKKLAKILVQLIKEDKIYRKKSEYYLIKYATWKTSLINASKPLPFKVPYFNDIARFRWGEHLLIGGQTGSGKTNIAMNIIKRLVDQGIKPKLFESEPGKNFIDIALRLGLKEGEFEYDDETPFYEVTFDNDSVIIIDWINPIDYAKTDQLFRQINSKLLKSNSFLISFMQLKKNHKDGEEDGWFAPNLVDLYPSFAVRFLLMDKKQDREHGHFVIDKVNKPIFPRIWDMPTKYFNEDCSLKLIEEIEEGK